jgi:hypothetical protein
MSQRYLVLDSDPANDSFRWDLDEVLREAVPDYGFEYRFRDRQADDLSHDKWEAKDTKAILTLVANLATPAHYLMIEAGEPETVDEIAAALEGKLPVLSLAQLKDRAERFDQDPSALVRLALGSDYPQADADTVRIIERALEHEQPLIRFRAAEAAALAPNADLRGPLDAVARNDPDESVRQMAEIAGVACRPG